MYETQQNPKCIDTNILTYIQIYRQTDGHAHTYIQTYIIMIIYIKKYILFLI